MPPRCFSLCQRPFAAILGTAFAKSFAAQSTCLGKGEIALFRAMEASLTAIGQRRDVIVEEYHGSGHQVTFKGNGSYSRTQARCELSDLLVIVYDRQTKDARLTYIQAKSERIVPAGAHGVRGLQLAANLEQWDLLKRRPRIKGVGSFAPPVDLLSSALLESIGSFVFFLHGTSGVEVQYAAASKLRKPANLSSRYGRLIAPANICQCGPTPECLSVYGNAGFGAFLFGLMIGTPVLESGKPTTSSVCSWLGAQLRGFAAGADGEEGTTELANELADLLNPERTPEPRAPNVGAKTLLLFGVGDGDRRAD